MCNSKRVLAVVVMALMAAGLGGTLALAGQTGGPTWEIATAPVHDSIYFDIPFNANEPAVVSVAGNGRTNLQLFMYDSDGHYAQAVGSGDQLSVTMDVYRAGTFRIEVRNLGPLPNTFKLSTN